MPAVDSQQNYQLISLTEKSGKTTMKFSRKFDTCDSEDNKIEVNKSPAIRSFANDVIAATLHVNSNYNHGRNCGTNSRDFWRFWVQARRQYNFTCLTSPSNHAMLKTTTRYCLGRGNSNAFLKGKQCFFQTSEVKER